MDVLRMPYGPWKNLLNGSFEGYRFSIYQNPDRDLFAVIADKDETGKTKGFLVIGYKTFKAEGNIDAIMQVQKKGIAVCKRKGDEEHKYVILTSTPKYTKPSFEDLSASIEKIFNYLEKEKILLIKSAKASGIKITPMKFASKKEASFLLSEPLLISTIMPGIKPVEEEMSAFPLGMTRSGNVIKEPLIEFRATLLKGMHENARKKFLGVLVENFALGGIPTLLITNDWQKYTGMKEPSSVDLKPYKITGIGFPVRIMKLGEDYFVDPNVLTTEEFSYVLGIGKGSRCYDALEKVLTAKKGEITDINWLEENVNGDSFGEIQLSRVLRVFGGLNGKTVGKNGAAKYLQFGEIGNIYLFPIKGTDELMGALSVLKTLVKYLEKVGSRSLRMCCIVENFKDTVKKEVVSNITDVLCRLLDLKCGVVIEGESDTKIPEKLLQKLETRVITASEDEVGIRAIAKRPYRIKIRPHMSKFTLISQVL